MAVLSFVPSSWVSVVVLVLAVGVLGVIGAAVDGLMDQYVFHVTPITGYTTFSNINSANALLDVIIYFVTIAVGIKMLYD